MKRLICLMLVWTLALAAAGWQLDVSPITIEPAAAAVVAALLIMAVAWILLEKAEARAWAPDEVFPMANSRIQWIGAGYRR